MPHLIHTVTELGERGVGFCSLTEAIDTTTAGGRLLFGIMASLAEFERQVIRERRWPVSLRPAAAAASAAGPQ